MATSSVATVTKQQLLEACDALERERLPALTRTNPAFRPGHGLKEVRKVIRSIKAAQPFSVDELGLALATKLVAHEPWDNLRHELLEPMFDMLRLIRRFPAQPRPLKRNKVADHDVAIHGDLVINGDLTIRGLLLVAGSLAVNGAIHALGDEWWSGTLVVLGDVRALRMNALGPCAIGGTLRLKQGLSTAYYHDTDSSLIARRIEAPIWFDRGDIKGRVRGTVAIEHRLRFEAWIAARLPKYFDDELRKVAWQRFDAPFYRAAKRAAVAAKAAANKGRRPKKSGR